MPPFRRCFDFAITRVKYKPIPAYNLVSYAHGFWNSGSKQEHPWNRVKVLADMEVKYLFYKFPLKTTMVGVILFADKRLIV